nr:MAG TPA: hypothetical protein [Caudoviricetes sp.]
MEQCSPKSHQNLSICSYTFLKFSSALQHLNFF